MNEDSQQLRLTHDEWVRLTGLKADYKDFYNEVSSAFRGNWRVEIAFTGKFCGDSREAYTVAISMKDALRALKARKFEMESEILSLDPYFSPLPDWDRK